MRYVEQFTKKVVTASPSDTLATVARLMDEHNVGAVVITDHHRPVGIVTDRDVALALGARGATPELQAARVMGTPVETVRRKEGVFAATRAMMQYKVRRLTVVDDEGNLVGIVSFDDLLRLLGRELSNLTEAIAPEMKVK
jgi:CBS domain-containing protein